MQGHRNYDCAKNVKNKKNWDDKCHAQKKLDDLPFWISKHWKFVWKLCSIVESCRGQASPIVSCSWGVLRLSHQIENVSLPLFENRIFWARTTLLHQRSERRIWYFYNSFRYKKSTDLTRTPPMTFSHCFSNLNRSTRMSIGGTNLTSYSKTPVPGSACRRR